jgi:hypothetical protein
MPKEVNKSRFLNQALILLEKKLLKETSFLKEEIPFSKISEGVLGIKDK